jgi:ADP-dependent phosphofructokinase/glucokinase
MIGHLVSDHKGPLSSIYYITEFKPHEILWTGGSIITVNQENKFCGTENEENKHFSVLQRALRLC